MSVESITWTHLTANTYIGMCKLLIIDSLSKLYKLLDILVA